MLLCGLAVLGTSWDVTRLLHISSENCAVFFKPGCFFVFFVFFLKKRTGLHLFLECRSCRFSPGKHLQLAERPEFHCAGSFLCHLIFALRTAWRPQA